MSDQTEDSVVGSPGGEPADRAAWDGSAGAADARPGGSAEHEGPQPTTDELERDIDELTAKAEKADEYLELAQRTKADFENFRKRAARDAAAAQDRGVAKLAKELLPAIDNLDRAVTAYTQQAPEGAEEPQLLSGIKLVHSELLAALARGGIAPYAPTGEPFDPQLHEAVAQHHVEGTTPGTVIEVYQQGYRLGDTVLRPARVLVAA